jgi:hypothetical protein
MWIRVINQRVSLRVCVDWGAGCGAQGCDSRCGVRLECGVRLRLCGMQVKMGGVVSEEVHSQGVDQRCGYTQNSACLAWYVSVVGVQECGNAGCGSPLGCGLRLKNGAGLRIYVCVCGLGRRILSVQLCGSGA